MAIKTQVELTRWQGSQHPTLSAITRQMKKDGLRPYDWKDTPNRRYAVRSHNYHRILYVTSGSLEVIIPDSNQSVKLRPGDRIMLPANVRHGIIVGSTGVECLEAALKR